MKGRKGWWQWGDGDHLDIKMCYFLHLKLQGKIANTRKSHGKYREFYFNLSVTILSVAVVLFSQRYPQYDMDIFGVLLLAWLRKDTNYRSELKPVFIYTGIHMFTSCSIVLVSNLTKATLSFYTLQSSTIWFTGHPSNKDMDWKKQTTLNGTKTHFGNSLTNTWNIWVIQVRLIEHLFTINSTTSIITK